MMLLLSDLLLLLLLLLLLFDLLLLLFKVCKVWALFFFFFILSRVQALLSRVFLGYEVWKRDPTSRHYDSSLIKQRLAFLREVAKSGDVNAMMFHLRAGMLRNFSGITNPRLYQKTHTGTKVLVEDVSDPLPLPPSSTSLMLSIAAVCSIARRSLTSSSTSLTLMTGCCRWTRRVNSLPLRTRHMAGPPWCSREPWPLVSNLSTTNEANGEKKQYLTSPLCRSHLSAGDYQDSTRKSLAAKGDLRVLGRRPGGRPRGLSD